VSAKIKPGSTWQFDNRFVGAQRALNQTARKLRLKVVLRTKPALKRVVLAALKIEDFHEAG
jgi:hypothetical protein